MERKRERRIESKKEIEKERRIERRNVIKDLNLFTKSSSQH